MVETISIKIRRKNMLGKIRVVQARQKIVTIVRKKEKIRIITSTTNRPRGTCSFIWIHGSLARSFFYKFIGRRDNV